MMEEIYFGNRQKRMLFFLVIYDIADDRRRYRISKLLEAYGKRIQFSAFECWLDYNQYNKLICLINKISDNDDNIRIYNLSRESRSIKGESEQLKKCDIYIV